LEAIEQIVEENESGLPEKPKQQKVTPGEAPVLKLPVYN